MAITKATRRTVWETFNNRCAYCSIGLQLKEMQIDHKNPRALGGTDELSNLFSSCQSCNYRKSTFTIDGFRKQIQNMYGVLYRNNSTFRNLIRFGIIQVNKNRIDNLRFYFEEQENNE